MLLADHAGSRVVYYCPVINVVSNVLAYSFILEKGFDEENLPWSARWLSDDAVSEIELSEFFRSTTCRHVIFTPGMLSRQYISELLI